MDVLKDIYENALSMKEIYYIFVKFFDKEILFKISEIHVWKNEG